MADEPTSILAPFDDETQEFLGFVDQACKTAMDELREERNRCEKTGEEFQLTYEVAATLNMVRAFGILYNRSIDAGWIKGVHTEQQEIILE